MCRQQLAALEQERQARIAETNARMEEMKHRRMAAEAEAEGLRRRLAALQALVLYPQPPTVTIAVTV